ncbi:multidrug resistance-associated protein 5-like [Pecten maximus]|uniref:multidrug resistance-associated protein 5-like n=1 Tax=Pecten maximus TaxID=6579 RepID=UPI0014586739|nr:multidrug resistance-associated protein 5-like [Pecten maximus]
MSIFNCVCNSIAPITPAIAAVATVALYVKGGNGLTASLGFSIIATLYFMRTIVSFVPYAVRLFGETRISFERIKNFMLEEEFIPPSRDVLNPGNAIELHEAMFAWDACNINTNEETKGVKGQATSSLFLKNINLTVNKGKHIGICGAVGCGKSSLFQALIGRMPLVSGHLAVGSAVAYAGQQAWIFNGTLRDNILFGRPYEQDWYRKVLHACSLNPDLRILVNGDQTEIGDRGTNLSGGQKQRVSLARAVYSKREIYLLDDPLSAVDSQVGQHLFHTCIDEVLSDKTVLLVTHQLQYLKHCDEIYVMDDGKISEHGTHEALLSMNGHYAKLMDQFDSTSVQSNTRTCDGNQEGDFETNNVKTSHQIDSTKTDNCTNNNNEKGILTDRETSVSGSISIDAYISYVRAAGGKLVIAIVLLVYLVSISSTSFIEWWLGIWIEQTTVSVEITSPSELNETGSITNIEDVTTFKVPTYSTPETAEESYQMDWYLDIFVYAAFAVIGLVILKATVAGKVAIKASVNLHNNAIGRVMSSPMQYFDANPTGRILNRFSRDVDEADMFIPFMLDNFLQMSVSIVIAIASVAYNYPWLILPIVPIGLCVYIIPNHLIYCNS